jgi:hypothetical protein
MDESRPKTLLEVLNYTEEIVGSNKRTSKVMHQKFVLRSTEQTIITRLQDANMSLYMNHCDQPLVRKISSRLCEIFPVAVSVTPTFYLPQVVFTIGNDSGGVSTDADRLFTLPDGFVLLHLEFDPSYYTAVMLAVFWSLEDTMRFPLVLTWIANGWFKNRRLAFWAQDDEFDISTGGSIAWSFAVPFVGGIVAAARSERCATAESDDVTALLLDRRLVRTRGNLMSSYRAGLIFSFLPMPQPLNDLCK